ncbi:hypothetical protein WH47_00700 [Habropoda laboriosa]|uniref:Uncharacterized protein n=1 Tax=Habropoda laboriosa TaxID=597456 RepID=A0A0L7QYH3_9HYME|nr:hypothetical protein WH47_00700 [Habropoda laboriosa]
MPFKIIATDGKILRDPESNPRPQAGRPSEPLPTTPTTPSQARLQTPLDSIFIFSLRGNHIKTLSKALEPKETSFQVLHAIFTSSPFKKAFNRKRRNYIYFLDRPSS